MFTTGVHLGHVYEVLPGQVYPGVCLLWTGTRVKNTGQMPRNMPRQVNKQDVKGVSWACLKWTLPRQVPRQNGVYFAQAIHTKHLGMV